MRVKIYQINHNRDTHQVKFENLSHLEMFQGSPKVDASIYDEVFSAEMDTDDLEALYAQFNTKGHPLHRGHSMSVSDVVVTPEGAFFCDSVGFAKVDFDESKTQKPDNLLKTVYVEPGKAMFGTLQRKMDSGKSNTKPPEIASTICATDTISKIS